VYDECSQVVPNKQDTLVQHGIRCGHDAASLRGDALHSPRICRTSPGDRQLAAALRDQSGRFARAALIGLVLLLAGCTFNELVMLKSVTSPPPVCHCECGEKL